VKKNDDAPYPRRRTKPLPREELAPIRLDPDALEPPPETRPALAEAKALARSAEDDIVTQQRCPLCCGAGMVPPEIAITFDHLCEEAKRST